jgi:hypothetical protein
MQCLAVVYEYKNVESITVRPSPHRSSIAPHGTVYAQHTNPGPEKFVLHVDNEASPSLIICSRLVEGTSRLRINIKA